MRRRVCILEGLANDTADSANTPAVCQTPHAAMAKSRSVSLLVAAPADSPRRAATAVPAPADRMSLGLGA